MTSEPIDTNNPTSALPAVRGRFQVLALDGGGAKALFTAHVLARLEADLLAGVAASLTSILGSHLGAGAAMSGTHLISLPHGEAGPLRTFVPAPTSVDMEADSVDGAA
jgi:hypothetical protein